MIEAFFFGPSNHQVFAIYHPPVGGSGQELTVICPPLFNEYCARTVRFENWLYLY